MTKRTTRIATVAAGLCAFSITALIFVDAGSSLLSGRFSLAGLTALVSQAPYVLATSTVHFQITKPHDEMTDQTKFTQHDAARGWIATTTKWKAVYDPYVADTVMLYDFSKDPKTTVDVAAANPQVVKAFSKAFLDWKLSSTAIPLSVKDTNGSVTTGGVTYQFSAPTSGSYGQVTYTTASTPDLSGNDVTFVAHIKSTDRDNQVRRIAFVASSWIFQINANNNLELVLFENGKATSTSVVGTKVLIKQGVDYDVSFNMEGMKYLRDYVRINVREHGSDSFVDAGSGLGVLQVRPTEYRLHLGMSLAQTDPFVGTIGNVKVFEAQVSRPELESFYPKTEFSCQLESVTIPSGSSVNAFSRAGTMKTATSTTADLCVSYQTKRTCTDGTLGGDTTYHYASCADMSGISNTSGGPGVVVLKNPKNPANKDSVLLMKQNGDIASGAGTTSKIMVYQSFDAAKTWAATATLLSTTTTNGGAYMAGNIFTLELQSGRLVTAYRLHSNVHGSPAEGADWDTYELRTKISDDDGKTWQEGGIIDTRSGLQRYGTWEPTLIEPTKRIVNGKRVLQAYFASERPASTVCPNAKSNAQDIVMKESYDEGKTWTKVAMTSVSRGISREGVPGVTELTDGSLLLAFETFKDSETNACGTKTDILPGLAHSNDGGATWKYLPTVRTFSTDSDAHAGWPHLITLADGRVVIKVATDQDHHDAQNDPLWISTSNRDVKFLVSKNVPTYAQPPVWSDTPVLALYGARWGDMAQLKDGSVIAVGNDFNWGKSKMRVVPLSELK